jgi:hypothetical protein
MKRNVLGIAVALCLLASVSFAQGGYGNTGGKYNHAELGAFVNYTRLADAGNTNFFGAGARLGFNLNPSIQLEAEGAYDFQRTVTVDVSSGGGTFTSVRSGLRMTHFMFGPKLQFGGSGPVHVFVTVKGGLVNFSNNASFAGQVSNIPNGNTDGLVYPAGGIEFFAGWLGLRFEAGDEIYFDHGSHNNLRVTAGPVIRF